jgi:aerobic-type carbon monoxide dehydrogenase small subunit (CoxS/CutS family)
MKATIHARPQRPAAVRTALRDTSGGGRAGRRANACLALAMAHDGAEITTVEGPADRKTDGSAANDEDGAGLHPLQDAFLAYDAFQCG